MKIISAKYLTSAVNAKQYPETGFPEIAFAGRSNVGKSSLINSLLVRKKLVKTSATPGKTQMINFFKVNNELIFTDLPGYGFAKVPAKVQKEWQNMIEQYLTERKTLRSVVFIVDMRRKPTELDLTMKQWFDDIGIDFVLVATKADKLSQPERNRQMKIIREKFTEGSGRELIAYSSKSNRGRKELWSFLTKKLGQAEYLRK